MRYLTLAADYGEVAIRDEQRGAVTAAELQLPDDLTADIVAWNDRYQLVIPADVEERGVEPMASLIRELDDVGRQLAERISDAVEGGAKVKYYSEGLLRKAP
jgi:hypothetical protein